MNVLTIYFANEHIQSLKNPSGELYMAYSLEAGPSLRDRIAAAVAGLRRIIGSPVESAGVLPKLEDYPYRG